MEFEFKKKILLVDDNSHLLSQMKRALENESKIFEVIPTSSTNEALGFLEKEDFDGIVSDYQIFDINSLEFLREVRKEKEIEIPLIIFTEEKKQEIILNLLKSGANRIIYRRDDIILFCKVLDHVLKQEILHSERKKELEHFRKEFESNEGILDM